SPIKNEVPGMRRDSSVCTVRSMASPPLLMTLLPRMRMRIETDCYLRRRKTPPQSTEFGADSPEDLSRIEAHSCESNCIIERDPEEIRPFRSDHSAKHGHRVLVLQRQTQH